MNRMFATGLAAAALMFSAFAAEKQQLTAHEWGTFTSVQGADGVQLEWNPYVVAELPDFVYDRSRPRAKKDDIPIALLAAKISMVARQRMETPVIYFYAPEETTVDVHVGFKSGAITEWYPQAEVTRELISRGKSIDWKNVRIMPGASDKSLKRDRDQSHYYAARETEAALLSVSAGTETELEKFLFYRGIGSFEAPLRVTQDARGERLTIRNTGNVELKSLVVFGGIESGKGIGPFLLTKTVPALAPGESRSFSMGSDAAWDRSTRKGLSEQMTAALERDGLYKAEATAMVNTWEDSWLEPGVRVLYLLPKAWTDEILPLTITPAPREIARVMVGRAEVITPRMETMVDTAIRDFAKGEPALGEMAIGRARSFPFSRFNDAIVRKLVKKNPDKAYVQAAGELIMRVSRLRDEQKLVKN